MSLALLAAACAGGPSLPSGSGPSLAAPWVTPHFSLTYPSSQPTTSVEAIAGALEREYARIISDLGAGSMPHVNVRFYADRGEMAAAVAPIVGSIPSWTSGLVTAVDQIHVMTQIGATDVVHEFAHCVSMRVNPRIPNNPRWLWEAVAIYEAGQFVNPRTLPYMVAGAPPSFATLSSFDNTLVYEVGYTIAEFVVARGGLPALAQLVSNHGDVMAVFGITLPEFERAWQAFVRDRHGL